jgi:hypothetical protein
MAFQSGQSKPPDMTRCSTAKLMNSLKIYDPVCHFRIPWLMIRPDRAANSKSTLSSYLVLAHEQILDGEGAGHPLGQLLYLIAFGNR